MIIPENILKTYGGVFVEVEKDGYVFAEEDKPLFYYQVMEGSVKMSSFSEDGQEFTQGIFHAGQSFGEPALFGNFPYPNNAIATESSRICRLPKEALFSILEQHPDIQRKFYHMLSHRLRYKAMILKEISSYCPDHIIMTLLNYLKKHGKDDNGDPAHIPYTRQQIADMTGLRVETVIRTVRKLQKEDKLEIRDHKIIVP
jgi:CRP-like cAMP-binding protein